MGHIPEEGFLTLDEMPHIYEVFGWKSVCGQAYNIKGIKGKVSFLSFLRFISLLIQLISQHDACQLCGGGGGNVLKKCGWWFHNRPTVWIMQVVRGDQMVLGSWVEAPSPPQFLSFCSLFCFPFNWPGWGGWLQPQHLHPFPFLSSSPDPPAIQYFRVLPAAVTL